jgi:transposase
MYGLFIGVDVSKDFFSAVGLDKEDKELFSGTYEMNSNGFSEILRTLSSHGERRDQVMVAMESTGCYHINLFSFLTVEGIRTVVVNPLLISNFAKLPLRKTKTDKKDASTIAKFLLAHQEGISELSVDPSVECTAK